MTRGKILIIVGVCLILLAATIYFIRQAKIGQKAGIVIESEPQSTVFIGGAQVGTTPYRKEHKVGELVIKLVPFVPTSPLATYETKIALTGGVETVLRRQFAATEEASSGELLSFEKIGGPNASLAVVSSPDNTHIEVDAKNSGFTPLKIDPIDTGDHKLKISAPGYESREVLIKTVSGFRLTALVKLAASPQAVEASEDVLPTVEEPKKTVVEILTTPTGFLRVRAEPSTSATESARVTPGKKYEFLEEKTGWYKIEYLPAEAGKEGKSGWVSAEYAKKVEE